MHLSSVARSANRIYLYDLSIHGALFLSETPVSRRASITAFRDPNFLRTFYTRLRRNEEDPDLRKEGYEWVSHCQGESNFLRPSLDGTAIVFDDLVKGGELLSHPYHTVEADPMSSFRSASELTYGAGSLSTPFLPDSLRVSPRTGYLFHPSPIPRRSQTSPYGPYSLLRSALVLDHFASTLDLEDKGGSYEFEGTTHAIKQLDEKEDVWWRADQKL
jgi:hypothetical protein